MDKLLLITDKKVLEIELRCDLVSSSSFLCHDTHVSLSLAFGFPFTTTIMLDSLSCGSVSQEERCTDSSSVTLCCANGTFDCFCLLSATSKIFTRAEVKPTGSSPELFLLWFQS